MSTTTQSKIEIVSRHELWEELERLGLEADFIEHEHRAVGSFTVARLNGALAEVVGETEVQVPVEYWTNYCLPKLRADQDMLARAVGSACPDVLKKLGAVESVRPLVPDMYPLDVVVLTHKAVTSIRQRDSVPGIETPVVREQLAALEAGRGKNLGKHELLVVRGLPEIGRLFYEVPPLDPHEQSDIFERTPPF